MKIVNGMKKQYNYYSPRETKTPALEGAKTRVAAGGASVGKTATAIEIVATILTTATTAATAMANTLTTLLPQHYYYC